jgi:putative membrane-bound dehydrogenase-like protein
MIRRSDVVVLACSLFAASLFAASVLTARAVADEFPKPYDSETDLSVPRMPAAEAAAKFRVPAGFQVSVFAAEPEVMNPISVAWDTRGRLWVAENFSYAERPKKFDLALRDRILIFHDRDGDGTPDERKTFLDDITRLTSIEVGLGGVWLMCPPQLLFVPDRNGDDVPDGPPETVLEGFTVPPENFHNFANGLHWGPDGWLYGRCGASAPGLVRRADKPDEYSVPLRGGIWRFHPKTRQFDALCHGTTNPWGHDWNADGEAFFINTVNGHLWHMIAGAHYRRPHTINANPLVYEPIEMHADHWHWDTGKDWADSRKATGEHDRLGGGHAHVGMCIYGGEQWPAEYRGRLFTLNQHGRRMNVERLEREGSGYVGKHEPDMLFAADQWFRGTEVTYGPDGSVYLVDWNDTGECHEHTGVHRNSGRIFRVTYGDPTPTAPVDLTKVDLPELVVLLLQSTDQWHVRAARREIADRIAADKFDQEKFEAAVDAETGRDPNDDLPPRDKLLRLLPTLVYTGALEPSDWLELLVHSDEQVRIWALRALVDSKPLDTPLGIARVEDGVPGDGSPEDGAKLELPVRGNLEELVGIEKSAAVRLAYASAMQRSPINRRPLIAAELVKHADDADDHNIPKMIWYGLIPVARDYPEALVPVAAASEIPLVREWTARRAAEVLAKKPEVLDALLAATRNKSEADRIDVVRGMLAGLAGHRKAKPPAGWKEYAASLASASGETAEALRTLNVVFGDGRAMDEVRKLALDGKGEIEARRAALAALIEANPPDLRETCEKLLKTRFLNTTALQGLTRFDDPAIGLSLAKNYKSFHHSERAAVIEALVARPSFAAGLLDQIAAGQIPRNDLTPFQARQIRSFNDAKLTARLTETWGELRDSPRDKQELMDRLKGELQPAAIAGADASAGRALFVKNCANCHRLFGSGGEIGPDLTGANRKNLDYILQNVVDPSAVVNKDFLMTTFNLADGRVVNGIVTSENEETLVVQSAQQKMTLLKSDVEAREPSKLSLMPDGVLQTLQPEQIRNLVAYLMSETQVEVSAAPAGEKE